MWASRATWSGQTIEGFPKTLARQAHEDLDAAIRHNLAKAWRAEPEAAGTAAVHVGAPRGAVGADEGKTPDAANAGQLGSDGRIARQGEKEVGIGGPGHDPKTGEVGGQALKPGRRV